MMRRAGLLALLVLAPLPALGAAGPVAVAKGKGPTKGAAATIAKALKSELEGAGVDVVDAKAAKKAKVDVKLAKAVGAKYLVLVDAMPAGKKFKARVSVIDVEDGGSIFSLMSDPYAGKKDAAAVARAVSGDIADAIKSARPGMGSREKRPAIDVPDEPGDDEDEEAPAAPAPSPSATPTPAPREEPREPNEPREPSEPTDPTPAVAPAKSEPAEPAKSTSGVPPTMLELGVGVGSQLSTAYTVLVGGQPTALAYTLSPLLLVSVGGRFQIPSTQLGVEAAFAWAPVKYTLATMPAPTPPNPGGSFLDIGLMVGWRFWLSGDGAHREGFAIEPQAGFRYESLSIDPQEPAIILSHSMIVPTFGIKALYGVSDALVIDAAFRLRLPLGYGESQKTTGDGGGGFGISIGGGARYWIADMFGIGLDVAYVYNSISFSGAGTRDRFASDPPIVDASVASNSLRLTVGPLVAF